MMKIWAFFYAMGVQLYGFTIRIAAFFGNPKAKLWTAGRRNWAQHWQQKCPPPVSDPEKRRIWFHVASLGEFEQGRPVIEALKTKFGERCEIVLTFFSPSGFEIRKNYPHADFVGYLPLDSPKNARTFLNIVQPDAAVFVKYEFWYFFLSNLKKRNIPTLLISAIFRPNQIFFRFYGKFFLNILTFFDHIFLQNESSKQLLLAKNLTKTTVAGDTRVDRVQQIAKENKAFTSIENWKKESQLFIFGSTWAIDEQILMGILSKNRAIFQEKNIRFIFVPHEIDAPHLDNLENLCQKNGFSSQKYTKLASDTGGGHFRTF
jgi:3-deoxy-D-manno-octulosonic-acid transferase